ncbi:hypothetical protein [Bradyrhizobium sp. USDA 3315]
MRYVLAVAFLYATATASFAEEAYLLTAQAFGTCVGTQMRFRYDPPERIAEVIKQRCGKLEEQEQAQFADFLRSHVGEVFTAELAFQITAHTIASLPRMREGAVEAYVKTMRQSAKPAPKPQPPMQLDTD